MFAWCLHMRDGDTQASTQVLREALFASQETLECSPEEPTGSDSFMTDQRKSVHQHWWLRKTLCLVTRGETQTQADNLARGCFSSRLRWDGEPYTTTWKDHKRLEKVNFLIPHGQDPWGLSSQMDARPLPQGLHWHCYTHWQMTPSLNLMCIQVRQRIWKSLTFLIGKLALSHDQSLAKKSMKLTTKAWAIWRSSLPKQGATYFLPSIRFKTQVHFLQVLSKWTLRNFKHSHDDGTFDWKIELAISNWHPW